MNKTMGFHKTSEMFFFNYLLCFINELTAQRLKIV